MAYFIRDDRVSPSWRGHGSPTVVQRHYGYRAEGRIVFINSAPTVMHDACVHENIPGVTHDPNIADPHERLNASFAARDEFAALFGPAHALCWDRLWTTNPDTAPACYFCGEPVLGKG
jgi:hypothetical protein